MCSVTDTTQVSSGTCTVFLIRCEGPGYSAEYRSVRKRELISVDLPNPDSPADKKKKNRKASCQAVYNIFKEIEFLILKLN